MYTHERSDLKIKLELQETEGTNFQRVGNDHIPCLFLPYDDGATKILIYFHGNAEDIGLAFDLLYMIG